MLTQRELDDIKGWAIEAAGLNEELVAVRRKSELVLSESLGLQAREEQILVRLYEIERDIVRTAVPRSTGTGLLGQAGVPPSGSEYKEFHDVRNKKR